MDLPQRTLAVLLTKHRQVVDDFSSKLDLPRPLEVVESIDANHRQMARCSDRADPQYRAIAGVLQQFMRGAALDGVGIGAQDMPSTMPSTASLTEPGTVKRDKGNGVQDSTVLSRATTLAVSPYGTLRSKQERPALSASAEKLGDKGNPRSGGSSGLCD